MPAALSFTHARSRRVIDVSTPRRRMNAFQPSQQASTSDWWELGAFHRIAILIQVSIGQSPQSGCHSWTENRIRIRDRACDRVRLKTPKSARSIRAALLALPKSGLPAAGSLPGICRTASTRGRNYRTASPSRQQFVDHRRGIVRILQHKPSTGASFAFSEFCRPRRLAHNAGVNRVPGGGMRIPTKAALATLSPRNSVPPLVTSKRRCR